MKLHELRAPEGAKQRKKRRGRGIAAGQGKTGGFGTKGQGARSGRGGRVYFEGGQLPLVNRLPIKRGFKNVNRVEYAVVNVGSLDCFEAGSVIDADMLYAFGLVKGDAPIKLLAMGDIDRPLTIKVNKCSESAKEKIESAGGAVEIV